MNKSFLCLQEVNIFWQFGVKGLSWACRSHHPMRSCMCPIYFLCSLCGSSHSSHRFASLQNTEVSLRSEVTVVITQTIITTLKYIVFSYQLKSKYLRHLRDYSRWIMYNLVTKILTWKSHGRPLTYRLLSSLLVTSEYCNRTKFTLRQSVMWICMIW